MKEVGVVERIENNLVWVRIVRKSACGENCATCKGGCVPTEQIVCAKTTCKVQVGDRVLMEMSSQKVIGAAFLVYIIPLIVFILGYFIGEYILKSEVKSIISGTFLMMLSIIFIRIFDKKSKDRFMAEITKGL